MKIRTVVVLGCLIGVAVLCMGAGFRRADSRVGVVSIKKIFKDCKKSVKYRQEAVAEQNRLMSELSKLGAEIEAEEAGLKTLKAGSKDYLALTKEILDKRASFQAQQEFYKLQMASKQQEIIEDIYGQILRETRAVAEQKGLALVFESSEPELGALSVNELEQVMATHKLLYSGGSLDITDEVMARLDAEESEKLKPR